MNKKEFIPDLGKHNIEDLVRLSWDISFRKECYRKANPDLIIEDSCLGTAKNLVNVHGKRISNQKGIKLSELKITIEDYKDVAIMIDNNIIANNSAKNIFDIIELENDYRSVS